MSQEVVPVGGRPAALSGTAVPGLLYSLDYGPVTLPQGCYGSRVRRSRNGTNHKQSRTVNRLLSVMDIEPLAARHPQHRGADLGPGPNRRRARGPLHSGESSQRSGGGARMSSTVATVLAPYSSEAEHPRV